MITLAGCLNLSNPETQSTPIVPKRTGTANRSFAIALRINDIAPDFSAQTHQGGDPFPRLDRRQLPDRQAAGLTQGAEAN
jgi:hypothetical protein